MRDEERPSVGRREMLRYGLGATAGLWLNDHLRAAEKEEAGPPPKPEAGKPEAGKAPEGKAKAVIQIWMWGGPCHIDTFDPKPEAGNDYCGPLANPIQTSVPGVRISELMPGLAKLADKFAIIRSMTHGQFGHETAAYMTQTGRMPGGRLVYPSVGAVVTAMKWKEGNSNNLIPPYIVLTEPQGRFSEAGFMGIRYKPFATGGDPNAGRFAVEGIVAPGISDEQQQERRSLLNRLDKLQQAMQNDSTASAAKQSEGEAYDLILGDAGKVFDLSQEKNELRQKYGRTTFGQSCLAARRLIEKGVRFVTINFGGWDTHKEHFQTMRRKLPELDRGMGTLIADLSDRGLLDSTIVWWGGEFGRTPKVDWEPPWNGGRGHYGKVFCSLVAGGGFKGGQVVGKSDAKGMEVQDRPVYPCDLIRSMYRMLGIDPDGNLPHPMGDIIPVTPSKEEDVQSAGELKEIT